MKRSKKAEQLRDSVHTSLDAIYKACVKVKGSWTGDSKGIPIKIYAQIIDQAKWDRDKLENQVALEYIGMYNQLITYLFQASTKVAKSYQSESVPLSHIKDSIEKIKKAFDDGMENPFRSNS